MVNSKTINVFFADDDEDDRVLFEEAISAISADIRLVTVENGNKLIESLSSFKGIPSIIFLDLNMPKKNGKETLKELRANSRFNTVPIVIYSTSISDIDIDETYKLGATLYLEKPYDVTNMADRLSAIVFKNWQNVFEVDRNEYFVSSKTRSIL